MSFGHLSTVIMLAILAGLLLSVVEKLVFYLPLLILTFLVATLVLPSVRGRFKKIYVELPPDEPSALKEVCEYYLYRPFYLIDSLTMLVLAVALVLAIYGTVTGQAAFVYAAYVISGLAIFVHEAFIWSWRIRRNTAIDVIQQSTRL